MQALIDKIQAGGELDQGDVAMAIAQLVSETVDDTLKAEFLSQLHQRGETADEISAFVRALLERSTNPGIDLESLPGPAIDICGTGGDGFDLFNVSTTIMFILAAGGAVVLKHGNRRVTSRCGSADVLEELGVQIALESEDLVRCVEELHLGFIFARHYHPVFRALATIRAHLARANTRTLFNLVGPLLNPAHPRRQLVGVYAPHLTTIFTDVLRQLGLERAWVVHGLAGDGAGLDDLSVCGPTIVSELRDGEITNTVVEPEDAGVSLGKLDELAGGDCGENAEWITGLLAGEIRGTKREMMLLNAAAGFVVAGLAENLPAGVEIAREQVDSGRALAKLRALQNFVPSST